MVVVVVGGLVDTAVVGLVVVDGGLGVILGHLSGSLQGLSKQWEAS